MSSHKITNVKITKYSNLLKSVKVLWYTVNKRDQYMVRIMKHIVYITCSNFIVYCEEN